MDTEAKQNVVNFILSTLSILQNILDEDAISSVKHYVSHNELEMAFEGLFIEIMKLKKIPQIDLVQSEKTALLLHLNEESVFDDNFWTHFQNYIHTSF